MDRGYVRCSSSVETALPADILSNKLLPVNYYVFRTDRKFEITKEACGSLVAVGMRNLLINIEIPEIDIVVYLCKINDTYLTVSLLSTTKTGSVTIRYHCTGITRGNVKFSVVTLWYRSPEVLLGQSYATPVDVWSIGCIMAELYMLKPLFCGSSEGDQLSKIFQILGKPREDEWPATNVFIHYNSFEVKNKIDIKSLIPNICDNAFDLIMRMLTFNPCKRICAAEALNHEYFLEEPIEI